jgi:cardiolipin synthase A/B
MSVVLVAVPVFKYRLKLHLDKGRPWSIVEHVILQALGPKPCTIGELEASSNLPRRIVIESIVRLMRAGWVEFSSSKEVMKFTSTQLGLTVAHGAELPHAPRRLERSVSFAVDCVSGTVFANRELLLHEDYVIRDREKSERIVRLNVDPEKLGYDVQRVQRVLLEDDESFVRLESLGERPSQRIALIAVRDGQVVDGLPNREVSTLRAKIIEAANLEVDPASVPKAPDQISTSTREKPSSVRQVRFSRSDLILDGARHKEIIKEILSTAASRVFIHSTFIRADVVEGFLPELIGAVRRGVQIDMLWGQSEDLEEVATSRRAIEVLRGNKQVAEMGDSLRIHPFSTGSHAKIVVADSRKGGGFLAVVGSCNWLTSPFKSYEASVVLRDPAIVADVVGVLANITHSHSGIWSDVTNELMQMTNQIASLPLPKNPNATASVVIGAHHNRFVLDARDSAKSRIFVTSHRLGPVSESAIIAPLASAASDGTVKSSVFFGRNTGAVKYKTRKRIIAEAASDGVVVEVVESPRLHAKILAWDSDNVVVSSLNWLSADPMSYAEPNEVGIFLSGAGLADVVIDDFSGACEAAEATAVVVAEPRM